MNEVKWRVEGIFKSDATKVYEEIKSIGEKVTPVEVLDFARNEDTELHKCFEWNNDVAAEKYRLQQARNVINMLYIVPKKENIAPVRVLSLTSTKSTYQPTQLFIKQEDEYQLLLKRAYQELASFKSKYKTLTELENVFTEIDLLIN